MDVQAQEMQAMKEIVDQCVGIPLFTYEMKQNAPRPVGDYAAVSCISSENPGFDESKIIQVDGVDKFQTVGIRILTFQILFVRDGQEYIDFDNSFFRPDVRAKMQSVGLVPLEKETLNLATLQLETNWEVRKAVKVRFNVIRKQISDIGTMSNAFVGGKFYDGDNVVTIKGS